MVMVVRYWFVASLCWVLPAFANPLPQRQDLIQVSQLAQDLQAPLQMLPETNVEAVGPRPGTSPIYTIDAQAIQRKGAQNLADALKGLPGFAINDVGPGADIHTGTFYRGQSISQSGIYLNGRPLGNGLNTYHGGTDFNAFPVEAIEKIQLSSGTSTTLYGSDAVGGVVDITTKMGSTVPKFNTTLAYGSYGESIYRTGYQAGSERLRYNLSYQSTGARNDYAVPTTSTNRGPNGQLVNGDTFAVSYQGSFAYLLDDQNTLTFDALKVTARKGLLYFGGTTPNQDRLNHDGLNLGLTWASRLSKEASLKTSISYNRDYFSTYGPSSTFNRTGVADAQNLTARIENTWQTSRENNLRWGLDVKNNGLTGSVVNTNPQLLGQNENEDRAITNAALFALDRWDVSENLNLEFGLRQTADSKFGSYFNPSVGTRWALSPAVALRGSWAGVQRNPGLDQLYLFDTVHNWSPNANLLPETGSAWTVGTEVQFSPDFQGQFTYFGSTLTNRIITVAVAPGFTQWQNVSFVPTNGLEMALRWQIAPQWTSYLNYTYTSAPVQSGVEQGLQLSMMPFSVAQMGIGFTENGWKVDLIASYNSGSRRAFFGPPGSTIRDFSPAFTTLDLRTVIPVTPNLGLSVYLANLADVPYEKVNRIFLPGLTYRIGLETSF